MVKVNGTELDIAGKTLTEYLATTNYDMKRIAVERNGDIVPKAQYGETVLMMAIVLKSSVLWEVVE